MFNLLRIISILSLIIITAITVLAGVWARTTATDDLRRMLDQQNVALAQGYINSVWQSHNHVIVPLAQADPSHLKDNPNVLEFARDTSRYFQKMPILRVNIYSATGRLLISNTISKNSKLATTPASLDHNFVLSQINRTENESQLHTLHNTDPTSHIMQTVVPIMPANRGNTVPEGAVEVYFDLSEPWQNLWYSQLYGTGGIVAVFFIFLAIFTITSHYNESVITRQHEANIELAAAATAAEEATQQKSQFLANISHELRTPLNAIIGFSEVIKHEVIATIHDQKYHDYINDINSAGLHLLSLINDILDFSKAEAGKLELEISEVNATKMVQNCIRLIQPRAESGNVKIVEAMPSEQSTLMTDSKKFKQIMLNLLSNAVKFTPAGGTVHVSMWQHLVDNSFTFEVSDTGIGIAPKDISRAMSPFGQVENTLTRKFEGTGLGLPLTKKFVELMGGKFTIESRLGAGTTITFTLPYEITPHEGVVIKQIS